MIQEKIIYELKHKAEKHKRREAADVRIWDWKLQKINFEEKFGFFCKQPKRGKERQASTF